MRIENEFTVQVPIDELWAFLLDVERIAPCMPGAELTETIDELTWKGKVNMKFGPISLGFAGTVQIEERDYVAHRVRLRATGMEQKGKGAANASVTSWLEPCADGTTVKMIADIQLTGTVAQLSRGLLPEVTKQLTAQFAECLQKTVSGDSGRPAPAAEAPKPAGSAPATSGMAGTSASMFEPAVSATGPAELTTRAKPISGFRLGLSALLGAIKELVAGRFDRSR